MCEDTEPRLCQLGHLFFWVIFYHACLIFFTSNLYSLELKGLLIALGVLFLWYLHLVLGLASMFLIWLPLFLFLLTKVFLIVYRNQLHFSCISVNFTSLCCQITCSVCLVELSRQEWNGHPGRPSPPARPCKSLTHWVTTSPRLSHVHPAPGPVCHPVHTSKSAPPFTRRGKDVQKTELLCSPEQGRPKKLRKVALSRFAIRPFRIHESGSSASCRPSIKGPGKAAIQQSAFNVPSGIISLSLLSSYPSFSVHLYLRVRFHLIQEFQEPLNVSSFAQGPLTRSSPDPGVTSISLWSHVHSWSYHTLGTFFFFWDN